MEKLKNQSKWFSSETFKVLKGNESIGEVIP
jgi:hypothetical protein